MSKSLTFLVLCILSWGLHAQNHYHRTIQVPVNPCETLAVALTPNIKLFPNPADSELTITIPQVSGEVTLSILDLDGRILFSDHFHQPPIRLEIGYLTPGLYVLHVQSRSTHFNTQLLIAR